MSRTSKKIFLLWGLVLVLFGLALRLFPHHEISTSLLVSCAFQVLLFLIAVAIVKQEPNAKNKSIFANFVVFFALSIVGLVGAFLFVDDPIAKHFFDQYIGFGLYALLLAFSIVYVTVDVLFRDFKILYKYGAAIIIVGSFFGYYFQSFIFYPKSAYITQDVLDWKTMTNTVEKFEERYKRPPTAEELSQNTDMYIWKEGYAVATLHPDARLGRIVELSPYLAGRNYQILITKPIMMYMIYMSVLSIGFILLFFGYQYMKDPPQGAYIEKIMFLFLVFCSMEILHAWSAVKALEWQTFASVMGAGQYASLGVLLLIALFFPLRLRFITSANGEFYEQELATRPTGITRWRDTLDNMVIDSFFNRRALVGRLFVPASRRGQHLSPKSK